MRFPKRNLLLFWLLIIIMGSIAQIYISRENDTYIENEGEKQTTDPATSTDQANTTDTENFDVLEIQEDRAEVVGTTSLFEYKFVFSSSLIGLLLVSFIALLHISMINSPELKQFIGTSLKLAGFKGQLSTISRKIKLENGININIFGIQKIKVEIRTPLFPNYMYFGLREELNRAVTITDLENFPVKILIIQQYLMSNQWSNNIE